MFDFFKSRPNDVKGIRSAILNFMKEELQKVEGGEGSNMKGLCLYITCNSKEKHLYEGALYIDEEDRFKEEEVQKIADDYAISLPPDWALEFEFIETPPIEAVRADNVDVALFISTNKKPKVHAVKTAYVRVLNGDTDQEVYELSSSSGKINIGREKKAKTADGFFRLNTIAFLGTSDDVTNRSVSRQHAHIEWDKEAGAFYIYADEGGIPPYNKMKVRAEGGVPVKLMTTDIGHKLCNRDQVILGESAVLEYFEEG